MRTKWGIRTRLLIPLLAFLSIGVLVGKAQAHGFGKQELMQVEAGPYLVSAWVDPRDITTDDEVHISISVQWRDDLYSDARVEVVIKHRDGKTKTVALDATHENASNRLFYETKFHPPTDGKYDVTVVVDSDEAGHGEATFDMDVVEGEKTGLAALWANSNIRLALVLGVVVLVGFVYWIFDRRSNNKEEA